MAQQDYQLFLTKFDRLEALNYQTGQSRTLVKVAIDTSESNLQSFYGPKNEFYVCYNSKSFFFINPETLETSYTQTFETGKIEMLSYLDHSSTLFCIVLLLEEGH